MKLLNVIAKSQKLDRFLTQQINRTLTDHAVNRNSSPNVNQGDVPVPAPSVIDKITEHAARAKSLMVKTESVAEQSGPILDNYDATLTRFMANLSDVAAREKQLAAVLQGMGNATEIIDGAFQGDAEKVATKTGSSNGESSKS